MRENIKNCKKIVVKIGSSSITHKETGGADLIRLEKLVRELTDLHSAGHDVILVSSGAISVGVKAANIKDIYYDGRSKSEGEGPDEKLKIKQACAAIGQARLMMIYQKLFSEYNQLTAQVLMTKRTVVDDLNRFNAKNTFDELMNLGVIPVVNENDTLSTYEIEFGDNDTLSAIVAAITEADLLILLSDIDGLYTDDPKRNPKAEFISEIGHLGKTVEGYAKDSVGSMVGTGGMSTKISAAKIASAAGVEMVIANAEDLGNIHRIVSGEEIGTYIHACRDKDFFIGDHLKDD
ncbi:MAG: glutamate 5-kinase [Lachnospiraceae bacterium]|nr:glutamate 5-kinase [Lachnospiraceae bacterium]